jgi:DNA invertase Pin-like site-specific DNA recombinase
VPGGTWVIYARLSKKKRGRRRNDAESVEEQIWQCREFGALHGLAIGRAYTDNHRSPWREDGERPAFIEMMAAAARGELVGILLFKADRFARNTPDAYALIKSTSGTSSWSTARSRAASTSARRRVAGDDQHAGHRL